MDPDLTQEAAELAEAAPAPRRGPSDRRLIAGQAGQNVLGLAIGAGATFAAQVLMANRLGERAFGVVTVATQFAFVAAAATRFGMDVAGVRLVAILVGRGETGRVGTLVRRSVGIALAVSIPFALVAFGLAPWLAEAFSSLPEEAEPAFRWAAVAVPLAAVAFTYLGATRGLKVMRTTLVAQWIVQPIGWIAITLALWLVAGTTAGWATAGYAASWGAALLVAYRGWRVRERRLPPRSGGDPLPEERSSALWRFGALRAPGTLFSQLIFWTDLFVVSALLARLGPAGAAQVGVYSGVLRAGQSLFLFLTSVSLTFSPFVADLHHRGRREELDALYKQVTRWTLAATIPVLLVLALLPAQALRVFGAEFVAGSDALRILIVGMIVPVMVGTVGFILIMAGRTGWDLLVYVGGFVLDVVLALSLARPEVLGIRGAAVAQAATLTASAVARLLLVRRFLGIWPFEPSYLRLVVPAAIGAGGLLGAHAVLAGDRWLVDLVASALVGTLAYAAAVLAVGLPRAEREAVRRLMGRRLGRRAG